MEWGNLLESSGNQKHSGFMHLYAPLLRNLLTSPHLGIGEVEKFPAHVLL
jgi:hypothetical protein